jgi:hypothetical protein
MVQKNIDVQWAQEEQKEQKKEKVIVKNMNIQSMI